jgi:hypothetical protein
MITAEKYAELKGERDQLLAVLKRIIEDRGDGFARPSDDGFAAMLEGRALIAKLEGRA